MLVFVLLQLASYSSGHKDISSDKNGCNINSSFFCPADNSDSICYYCNSSQANCVVVPNSILLCIEGHVHLLESYCLTYEPKKNKIFVGHCPYFQKHKYFVHKIISQNITELRCDDSLKRSGILCGECETDYYPLAYSYTLTCIRCHEGLINIWKVLLVTIIPLTVLCFLVVIFKVTVFSSHLHGLVFYSQAVAVPAFGRIIFNGPYIQQTGYSFVIKFLFSFYSVWNLDILRSFSPGICLQVKARNILWLDLAIGTYPLVVLSATYFIIQLYKYKITIFDFLLKHIGRILTKPWNISLSLIEAFATFLILSNVKILTSCMDLLGYTPVYSFSNTNHTSFQWRLYYDPTEEIYYSYHFINFCLCLLVVSTFVVLPFLMLLLYPCRCFQNCLNRTTWIWNALHSFMDVFQGSFKNGTKPGESDYRWFSAVFFGGCIILVLLYMVTFSIMYFILAAIVIVVIVLFMIILEPFRPSVNRCCHSKIVFLLLLSMLYVLLATYEKSLFRNYYVQIIYYFLVTMVTTIPVIYFGWNVLLSQYRCIRSCSGLLKMLHRVLIYFNKRLHN